MYGSGSQGFIRQGGAGGVSNQMSAMQQKHSIMKQNPSQHHMTDKGDPSRLNESGSKLTPRKKVVKLVANNGGQPGHSGSSGNIVMT